MTMSGWDDKNMLKEYQKDIFELLSDPSGMIAGDEHCFSKHGATTAGVARQRYAKNGKIFNCQVGVTLAYASVKGAGLVDFELFMPEKWFSPEFENKRKKCRVPVDLEFQTEAELVVGMINRLCLSGHFQGKYVGLGVEFSRDRAALEDLPKGLIYFAEVNPDHRVYVANPKGVTYRSYEKDHAEIVQNFPSIAVKAIADDETFPWNDTDFNVRNGGTFLAQDKCLRVIDSHDSMNGKEVWLYLWRYKNGKVKYALCNDSPLATLDDIRVPALARWSIEQCFVECDDKLGIGHYEFRTWHGWRRHFLLTLIAHLFTLKLRRQQISNAADGASRLRRN
jgi:SRSO17 transposase